MNKAFTKEDDGDTPQRQVFFGKRCQRPGASLELHDPVHTSDRQDSTPREPGHEARRTVQQEVGRPRDPRGAHPKQSCHEGPLGTVELGRRSPDRPFELPQSAAEYLDPLGTGFESRVEGERPPFDGSA